jgi:tripartite-type tricarboxylate transporter receptor subunit TctC/ABC-type nitrate/sulfonate/bicarbonate transport system substrate-binding protein
MKLAVLGSAVSIAMLLCPPAGRAAEPAFGTAGAPIRLNVGYTPYQSLTWSGVAMRGKRFYEKYLPSGSSVEFTIALQADKVAKGLLAGDQQIGYLGDVAAIQAAARPALADVRLVAVLGLSQDQCSVLLVRAAAPRFASSQAAIEWLNTRSLAAPQNSCMERFARKLVRDGKVAANLIVDQNIEVITAGFRAGRLDAAVLPEPSASRLVGEGVARRVASGRSVGQYDAAYLAMRADLIEQRPDVALAWLRAELDAQRFLADPANAREIVELAAAQTSGFDSIALWNGLYGQHSELEGGSALRISLPFRFSAEATQVVAAASAFLHEVGGMVGPALRGAALMPELTQRILGEGASVNPPNEIHALSPPQGLAPHPAAAGGLSLQVEPLGWGGGDAQKIGAVLEAVAQELLSRFPGRPLAPIRVSRSMQAPMALYERGPAGEYRIELTASGVDAGPYVYEFAHEFCHVLSNYERHPHHAITRNHQWFEEALCEVASLYTLKTLAAAWRSAAPSPELAAAAPQLHAIAERFQRESHRKLPPGMTLAAWFRQSTGVLGRSAYDRDRNEVVANLLLPLFEENPELWEAIGFLNLDAPGASFQQYLQTWLDNAPPRYQDVIRYAMTLFFARETAQTGAPRYPQRPIELIVTFGPGGGADGMARTLAALLEPLLGVPVIVSNVPGASGNAGLTKLLLSQDPDHTLATLIAMTVGAWAGGVGSVGPADFTFLGVVQDSPSMLFVRAESEQKTFAEFLALAKARPGSLRVATSGHGTLDDVTLAFLGGAGYRTLNAPFAKPEERYEAALSGRTDALFEEPGDVATHLASGRLRPLVAFADERHAAFKDVPSIREFGLAIDDLPNFRGLAMHSQTAPDKVKVLSDALRKALASPQWQQYCAQTYSCTPLSTPAQAKARVQALLSKVAGYLERLPR